MERPVFDTVFDGTGRKGFVLEATEYDECTFENCDFSNGDFSGIQFVECVFSGCDLSLVKLSETILRDAVFNGCKLFGVHFEHANKFGLSFRFEGCALNYSSFFQRKIPKTEFRKCQLLDTDFGECDLSGSVFDECDLKGAIFSESNLEKADFRTAYNYSIDPLDNRIGKAKFALNGLPGLLDKHDIVIENV